MNAEQFSFFDKYRMKLAYIACIALFVGLICSKFLISVSMITLVGTAIFSSTLKQDLKGLVQHKAFWGGVGIFILFLISALLSTNLEEGLVRVRIILPLLFLPLAFAILPSFSKRQYQGLLSIYIYGMFVACVGVLVYYLMHYEAMQHRLNISKAIPTPNGEHIRFSLMINLAVFAGFELLKERFYWKKTWEKWLLGTVVLFLMIMLHVLSVRIGIAVLYGGLLVTVFYYILTQRRFLIGTFLVIGILVTPYLAYKYVPSVQVKVNLTRHNWHLYQQGHIGEYSDTRRLLSYKIAWEVAQESSSWLGVGIGDLNDEQTKLYERDYPDQKVMYPHNFFLTLYAGTGILGLIFFLVCFFMPLLYRKHYKHLFFLLLHATIFLSFMTENTLLSAIGVAIYSFFLAFSLNYFKEKEA